MVETRGSLVIGAARALSAAGFQEPRRLARRLVASALVISQADLFGHPDRELDRQQIKRIKMMLGRLLAHEPLSRILGQREFWGLNFMLSAETLDPRPESETVVGTVLRRISDRRAPLRFLDLGTGTGCLLVALLSECPTATGVGVDIAIGAARIASYNAARLGFSDRTAFLAGDWGAAVSGRFDVILANPPYVRREDLKVLPDEVACYDPILALDGGETGLSSYAAIAQELPRLLVPGGIFATEIGADQAYAVTAIIQSNGLVLDGIHKDLSGNFRCVAARSPPVWRTEAENGWNTSSSRLPWH